MRPVGYDYAWAWATGYRKIVYLSRRLTIFRWADVHVGDIFYAVFPDGHWLKGVKK